MAPGQIFVSILIPVVGTQTRWIIVGLLVRCFDHFWSQNKIGSFLDNGGVKIELFGLLKINFKSF